MVETELRFKINLSSKSSDLKSFQPLRQRWVVERTFAWLIRYRRLSRDVERTVESNETMIKIPQINAMLHRLAPKPHAIPFHYRKHSV